MENSKQIDVRGIILHEGDIVNTVYGRARLDYIARQSFTKWTLIDRTEVFPFGKPITVEDNNLGQFILQNKGTS